MQNTLFFRQRHFRLFSFLSHDFRLLFIALITPLLSSLTAQTIQSSNDKPLPDGVLDTALVLPIQKTSCHATISGIFAKDVQTDALIVRARTNLQAGQNACVPPKAVSATFTHDGKSEKLPVNIVNVHNSAQYFDMEVRFTAPVLPASDSILDLEFSGLPAKATELTIFAVRQVNFSAVPSLANGLDFETTESTGIWVAWDGATLSESTTAPISGKKSLRIDFPAYETVAIIFAERDWSKYQELRFKLANPLPTDAGKRTRVAFIGCGNKIIRPTAKDSISTGALVMEQESTREFRFDLKKLAENCRDFNPSNVTSLQISWSPVACPESIFYLDDMRLWTPEEVAFEQNGKDLAKLDELSQKTESIKDAHWKEMLAKLVSKQREMIKSNASEIEIDHGFYRICEIMVIAEEAAKHPREKDCIFMTAQPTNKVFRDSAPQELGTFPWKISAAGNERESFQLIAMPLRELKDFKIEAGPLKGPWGNRISADAVTINPVGYIEVTSAVYYPSSRKGYWPDILLRNQQLDLPERLQSFYITVAVPPNQKPGKYKGTLKVHAANLPERTLRYQLEVYGFSLPARGKCKTFFSLSYIPNDREKRLKVYDMFFDYRLNPTNMYATYAIDGKRAKNMVPSFEDLPYCLEKGMNFMSIGGPVDWSRYAERHDRDDIYLYNDAYINGCIEWCSKCREELSKANAWDIAAFHGFDELMHVDAARRKIRLAEAVKICSALKKAIPDIKISNIGAVMDIDTSIMDYWWTGCVGQEQYQPIMDAGKNVGFYYVYGPDSYMLDLPGGVPRFTAWNAWRQGACGLGYYSMCRMHEYILPRTEHDPYVPFCTEKCAPPIPEGVNWGRPQNVSPDSMRLGRNLCGLMCYPDGDGALLPSVRMLNLRDGIEDYEYMAILQEQSKDCMLLNVSDKVAVGNDCDNEDVSEYIRNMRQDVAKAIKKAK